MGASQSTEIQLFSGGVSLMPASHLLNPTESRVLAGVNVRKGHLVPFLAPLFVETASGEYVYFYQDAFYYYDMYRSNVLYNRVWYWSSAAATGKVYPDGTTRPLGINPPAGKPIIQAQAATDGLEGSISYVYTYYDSVSGSESPPSSPSNTLDLLGTEAGQAVEISNLTQSPDGYELRLYRLGGIITVYTTVITLPSTATDYIDELHFTEMEGMILDTFRAFPPPTGLQYLALHQGRMFGAVNAELYFSAPGKPDSWYALDIIPFDDIITSVTSVANGLLVTSRHKTWLVSGSNPFQFALHSLSSSEGCISVTTMAVSAGTALWLSASGFVMSNGSNIVSLSLDKLGRIERLEPFGSVYVDKRYILSFTGFLYPSDELYPSNDLHPADIVTEAGVGLPRGAVVVDMSSGQPIFSTITDVVMGYITVAENEVYQLGGKSVSASNIVTETGAFNIVTEDGSYNITAKSTADGGLSKTFRGDTFRDISYTSPIYTEGSIGNLKQYEKIRIVYKGIGNLQAFDERDNVFVTRDLSSKVRKTEWIYIPVGFNRGLGIQFRIGGQLVVDSLLWTWTPKESQ